MTCAGWPSSYHATLFVLACQSARGPHANTQDILGKEQAGAAGLTSMVMTGRALAPDLACRTLASASRPEEPATGNCSSTVVVARPLMICVAVELEKLRAGEGHMQCCFSSSGPPSMHLASAARCQRCCMTAMQACSGSLHCMAALAAAAGLTMPASISGD